MRTINLEIWKRDIESGAMHKRSCDITPLTEILTATELYQIEFRVNEIPGIVAHLSFMEKE